MLQAARISFIHNAGELSTVVRSAAHTHVECAIPTEVESMENILGVLDESARDRRPRSMRVI